METQRKAFDILRRCELFLGLDDEQLERIAALPSCQIRCISADEVINKEGELATELYVLDEGKVYLTMSVPAVGEDQMTEVVVDSVTKGDVFGWSALVTPHRLTLSQVACEPSVVLAINGAELRLLLDEDHDAGYEVMSNLARIVGARLRDAQMTIRPLIIDKRTYFVRRPPVKGSA